MKKQTKQKDWEKEYLKLQLGLFKQRKKQIEEILKVMKEKEKFLIQNLKQINQYLK